MPGSQFPNDGSLSFEGLMKAGQELMQRFESAVTAQTASGTSAPEGLVASPRTVEPLFNISEIQRLYVEQIGVLWTNTLLQGYLGDQQPVVVPDKRDKRFRDEVWSEQPFYDLLKQS